MDWQTASDIASVVSAVIVVVSVFFIWAQLHQQTKLTKWSNAQSMAKMVMDFNLEIIRDDHMAGLWRNGYRDYENFDEIKKEQYESLVSWWLVLYETMTYLMMKGLLDPSFLKLWDKDFNSFIYNQLPETYWKQKQAVYLVEFTIKVNNALKQKAKERSHPISEQEKKEEPKTKVG